MIDQKEPRKLTPEKYKPLKTRFEIAKIWVRNSRHYIFFVSLLTIVAPNAPFLVGTQMSNGGFDKFVTSLIAVSTLAVLAFILVFVIGYIFAHYGRNHAILIQESPENKTYSTAESSVPENIIESYQSAFERAFAAIEYRDATKAAWKNLDKLPETFKIRFLEILEQNPNIDPAPEAERLFHEHQKSLNPFDSEDMNRALSKAREFGREVEVEFLRVAEILGADIDAEELLEKVKTKLYINIELAPGLYSAKDVGQFRVYADRRVALLSDGEPEWFSNVQEFLRTRSGKVDLENIRYNI